VQRIGVWEDMHRHDALQGASLLAALADLPVHTWSAVAQGEMTQLLQGLAWLYVQTEAGALTETVLALALRLATTPEQEVVLCVSAAGSWRWGLLPSPRTPQCLRLS